ncbi:hypothetical protein [Micromonospora eburnea]|uniref:hypothetical protein n=1 Tax=Micromonospora eburnea TaxID=227316 RepID=UPI001ABF246D|nr:hypothetical protein [Micromonospora eburnea]
MTLVVAIAATVGFAVRRYSPTVASVGALSFVNPVYTGDSPDPQAIRVGSTWYLVHTNSGGRTCRC